MRRNRDLFNDFKPGRYMVLGVVLSIVYWAALGALVLLGLHIAGVV